MEKFLSRWLDAHQDTSANLTTLSQCMTFSDVTGSGDHRLVLAHLNLSGNERSRLKTYRGPTLSNDQPLLEIPSGVVSFYNDSHEPRLPAIAVSCGASILLFKNNKPFFKFTLPTLPTTALEIDVWNQLTSQDLHTNIPDLLNSLRSIPYTELSSRSQKLLTLQSEQIREFVDRYAIINPSRISIITCLTTMNKNSLNKDSVACLVLATEHGQLYILDPQGFNIIHQASVNSTSSAPSHLCCSGMFDIDYRIIIACRDGLVCVLRREWFEGRTLMQIPEQIVDIQLLPDNSIIIANRNKEMLCYSKKGKKLWTLNLNKQITCLCLVNLTHLSTTLVGVGLRDGPFQLYQGKRLVDFIPSSETIAAAKFGHLGQEENVLVTVTQSGALMFKILKRTADFNLTSQENNNTPIDYQIKPLPLPKRSKLFAEQVQRERENTIQIHHTFQQDLIRLRLTAARNLVQVLQTEDQSVTDVRQPIKMAAQVLGLGPKFTLIITLENTSQERAVSNLNLILHTQIKKFNIERPFTQVPMLIPGLSYNLQTMVEEQLSIPNNGNEDSEEVPIRVFVFLNGHTQPLLAATINMPPTDPLGYV